MATSFNGRAFISLSAFCLLSLMLVTSILLFVTPHTSVIALLHTLIGFVLLLTLMWHLKNNFSSLKHHLRLRSGSRFNPAGPTALAMTLALLVLCLVEFRPFRAFYQWGNTLRAGAVTAEDIKFSYTRVNKIPAQAMGDRLTIDLRKGPYFKWPQYAIWLETLEGEFIQPLFVTASLGHNNFANKVTKRNPNQVFTSDPFDLEERQLMEIFAMEWDPASANQRARPESLPVFLHQQRNQKAEVIFKPLETLGGMAVTATPTNSPDDKLLGTSPDSTLDAYAGATVLDNFLMQSRSLKPLPERYKVRLEINQSFDFNSFYSSDRFPEDAIYSGNGYSAQPSVIYEAIINNHQAQTYYAMQLIGHGHHSGGDGIVYPDMENLTTAKQIIDRIIVEVKTQ